MPSWRLHEEAARRFLRELGLNVSPDVIRAVNRLVDFPREFLSKPEVRELLEEKAKSPLDKALVAILLDPKLKPLDELAIHDWGAWGEGLGVNALRRISELLFGEAGRLLAELHLALDAAFKGVELDGLDPLVKGFVNRYLARRAAESRP